ncbi:NAD(P)(+) transhydrogenase [Thioflexithrix psekupsensis]|uniref:Soluble pyridine nucleotide transhydrogenase n=1 Tax=Thioflexithrix psekupsensis TaxID=1570016 RepID=A0A251X873_9GAMM|nr:Si-specific NAD(P)(+) transhydrogenase [Thioflexithrix psekupsensis]OUD13994.1 NAD(P)(+) transhydrogenase [Thioflexithrix psekupsensis]
MVANEYDMIVIGSGPGGEGAAMKAVKAGKRVAIVEKYMKVGGGCSHWGTIPSKALRHAVQRLVDFRNYPMFEHLIQGLNISYPQLLKSAESVINKQVKMRQSFYDRNNVDVLHGHARFIDPHTVEVLSDNAPRKRYHAEAFIVASGSSPYRPKDIDFTHPRIHDSDTILQLDHTPYCITIYGAGVIGCEYASFFRGFDVKVNLINTRDKLLAFLDDEIIDALSYHLRDQGILIRHNEEYAAVEPLDDCVILHMKSGKQIKSDVLLFANGRSGNSRDMGLEQIGIAINRRGQLEVNANYQTSVPHIYAVGDIVGYPSLASAAYDQGRFAATHFVTGQCDHRLIEDIPTGIYTSPEISSVGRTERELTESKIPYEVGHAFFKSLARAQITGQTVGMLKILFHRETLEILGIHCFGSESAEIIHIGQAIMAQKGDANNLMYFINTTFNYPTMAEAYRVAALNGYNRL